MVRFCGSKKHYTYESIYINVIHIHTHIIHGSRRWRYSYTCIFETPWLSLNVAHHCRQGWPRLELVVRGADSHGRHRLAGRGRFGGRVSLSGMFLYRFLMRFFHGILTWKVSMESMEFRLFRSSWGLYHVGSWMDFALFCRVSKVLTTYTYTFVVKHMYPWIYKRRWYIYTT